MSYTETKTLPVNYIDHDYVQIGNGNIRIVEVPRIKYINVNVNVNTTPFDYSVERCGDHVGTLTDSVIGFKTANVASKIDNEKKIVNSVTSGFSSMIEQNLSLQNAGIEAEMHALAGELMQQCKELDYKHEVMNKDFNRIKSRYSSLFDSLTKELNNRLKQLIKPCFDFVSQVRQEQNRRIETSLLSVATTTGKESDVARVSIQVSKMKSNAEYLILTAKNYIIGNKSLNTAKAAFLIEGGKKDHTYFVPVIICYSSDETSLPKKQLFANPILNSNANAQKKLLDAASSLQDRDMSYNEKKQIGGYYNMMLSEISDGSARSQRLLALMKGFFDNNLLRTFVK